MNIVHLIFSLNIGGAETMLVDILNQQSLHNETHLIIVNEVINDALHATIDSSIKIHRINRRPGSRNPFPLLYLNLLMCKIGPDVVHMHNVDAIKLFPKWFSGSWGKFVTIHAFTKSCSSLPRYDKVFAISEAVKVDINSRSGLKPVVVFNGVNFQKIETKNDPTGSSNIFKIIQISRLMHQKKGQHLLIEAISKVKKRAKIKLEVTFVGEGESYQYLRNLAKSLGVEDICVFKGLWTREKIYQNLRGFDLLVQPSLYEGFGLTLIEGMGARIPVLASDGGGPEEVLGHGEYGWLFKNGDVEELSDSLSALLDPDNKEVISNKVDIAYNHAIEKYSIKHTSDNYMREYVLE